MTNHNHPKLYLDDLSIGQSFTSGEYHLSAQSIIDFAKAYDPQPFHTDAHAAENTFFKELVASGWQTMGITTRLLVQSIPMASGLVGLNGNITWPRPVRPGDTLNVESKIETITPSHSKPDRAVVTFHGQTFNQKGQVVLDFTLKIMAFYREKSRTQNSRSPDLSG